jgi:hypothetical protein
MSSLVSGTIVVERGLAMIQNAENSELLRRLFVFPVTMGFNA